MVDETESLNSDAQSAVSSEPQQEVAQTTGSEPAQADSQEQNQQAQETPFHEHPRFRELVEEKNTYRQQVEALAQRLQQMESQFQKVNQPQAKEDPLLARLKGIDPEFGERFEKLTSLEQQVEQFKQFQYEAQLNQLRTQAENMMNDLNTKAGVPEDRREFYNELVKSKIIQMGDSASLQDIAKVHKAVHDQLSKVFGTVERATTQKYVEAKKADAKVPSTQSKGKPSPKAPSQEEFSGSPDDVRAQMKAAIMRQIREGSNL